PLRRGTDLRRRSANPGGPRGSRGLPSDRRTQHRPGRDLGPLLRQRAEGQVLLRLRRAEPGGDQEDGRAERATGRLHHASQRARPVPIPVKEENEMKRSSLIVGSLVAAACVAALVVASASATKPATAHTSRSTASLAPKLAAARLATAKYATNLARA